MDQIWYYFLLIGGLIGIIAAYIGIGEYLIRFINWVFMQNKHEDKICKKILEWFAYIDINLTEQGVNLEELSLIEKEIDFLFKVKQGSISVLKFSNKFIDRYLEFVGLAKKYRTKQMFLHYSHIKHANLDLILDLTASIKKSKVTPFQLPLETFWGILRGNFHTFHRQYICEGDNISEEQKLTFADIEMPIKLLRIYYKIH